MAHNPKYDAIVDELRALTSSKNDDYATEADPFANFRECEAFGVPASTGILIRMSDKWSRIKQLANGKVPRHESFADSVRDLVNYGILYLAVKRDEDEAKKKG